MQAASDYLQNLWGALAPGGSMGGDGAVWSVDFGDGSLWPGLRITGRHAVPLLPEQVVIALSRGDAAGKSCFIWPEDCGIAYLATIPSERPRGFAFWNIAEEGNTANGTDTTLSFAPSLDKFLHTR